MKLSKLSVLVICYAACASFSYGVVALQFAKDVTSSQQKLAQPGNSRTGINPNQPGSTDPQTADNQNASKIDPGKWQRFMDRYNRLGDRSTGWCGAGTRETAQIFTDAKIAGANGGDFGPNLLATGEWREASPGEDYTGKVVVRSLQNNGYGHAEILIPDPSNPSQHIVCSDFRQRGSLVGSSRYSSHRDYVLIGKG